jgi:hypothetical protein
MGQEASWIQEGLDKALSGDKKEHDFNFYPLEKVDAFKGFGKTLGYKSSLGTDLLNGNEADPTEFNSRIANLLEKKQNLEANAQAQANLQSQDQLINMYNDFSANAGGNANHFFKNY